MKTLGQRIRALRDERDLSLRAFAQRLGGLSAAFLSDIELGRRYPSEKVLATMARVLGTTLEDLRRYDTRPPLEAMKRLAIADPAFGLALRKVIDTRVSPEELLKLAERKARRPKR
jgi:transcriptional regulator with XRE-family HTH domain